MARFYPLTVEHIRRETRDAVAVTLRPSAEHAEHFGYLQGQYLTFRRIIDGEEVRRSYSICTAVQERTLRVGIKRVDDGRFSNWANGELKVGDVIEAMPPAGSFNVPLSPTHRKHYVALAGGSGITPVLGVLKTTLLSEPDSRVTLFYGNRSSGAIMFREELEDLKNDHLGRLQLVHVLEREQQDIELLNGLLDRDKCASLLRHWVPPGSIDMAFVCGPEVMMLQAAEALRACGVDPSHIKFELFASPTQPMRRAPRSTTQSATAANCSATVVLDGRSRSFTMNKGDQSILNAALDEGIEAPFACKGGVCSTCRALLVEGEVDMDSNFALEDYEVKRGYVLTCQSYPLSDRVVVDYDQ